MLISSICALVTLIAVGAGKTIVWDAGVDWINQYSVRTRYRVTANGGVPTVPPPGFGLIPSGSFQMGDALDGMADAPPVTVNVSAFHMAKHEVTKALWDEVRTWGLTNGYTDLPLGGGKAANHPVHGINWYAMVKWCNARSQKEGLAPCYTAGGGVYQTGNNDIVVCDWTANGFRLPTEAEWEKAARGGIVGKRFPWGSDTISHAQANYRSSSSLGYDTSSTRGYHPTYNDGTQPYTSPVGSFAANGYGLHDMAGNVWERCWDWYSASTYTEGATDPKGATSGGSRAVRGGEWSDAGSASRCRVADRYDLELSYQYSFLGFRLACSSIPATSSATTLNGVLDTRAWTLSATAGTGGGIQGAGKYLSGTTATLTAAPNPGFLFTGWTENASGTANPLNILMDGNKTVGAVFESDVSDTDTDGLSAYLELAIYGTDPALADTDGDGLSDGWEVGRGRFSIVPGNFTWQQARTDARSKGGDLASFPDENRWNSAMETLGANALDDYTGLWLGASDAAEDGAWTWVSGETFSFQQWASSRPSISEGNTLDYAEVGGGAGAEIGKWYDRSPTTTRDGYLLETGYATDPKTADADGDGLNDSAEQAAGTNPFLAGTDADGLTDSQEVNLTHTNPKLVDSDGDGTGDAREDLDTDGLVNLAEITQHSTDPLKTDTDNDGLSDGEEVNHPGSFFQLVQGTFTYPQAAADAAAKRGRVASFPDVNDYSRMAAKARQTTQGYLWLGLSDAATEGAWLWTSGTAATYSQWLTGEPSGGTAENHAVIMENSTLWADTAETYVAAGYLFERVGLDPLAPDTDADGLTDGQELNTTHSSPVLEDTDADGLTDGAEVTTHGSSPLLTDTDADGLTDREEVEVHHSNPALKDSDGDGFDDLFEVNTGFDPASGTSTPDAVSSIRTAVEFRFNAANGVSYRIEGSTELNEWTTVETDIIGTGGVVALLLHREPAAAVFPGAEELR